MAKESIVGETVQSEFLIPVNTVKEIQEAGQLAQTLRLAVFAQHRLPIQLANAREKLTAAYGQVTADAMVAQMIAKLERRTEGKV